jgi:streptogrisin C
MRKLTVLAASAAFLVGSSFAVPIIGQDRVERPMDTENRADPGEQGQSVSTREAAIQADAQSLASSQGISLSEATKAVGAQDSVGDEIDRVRQEFAGRVAGIYFEYKPEYKIIVRLKGETAVVPRLLKLPGAEVPMEFESGASATAEELVAAFERNFTAIKALLPTLQGIGTDERTGEIMLLVQATGGAVETVRSKKDQLVTLLGHPVRIEVAAQPMRNADVRGGSKTGESANPANFCTSGFTVKNASNVTAMTTASHCETMNTYWNPNGTSIALTFVSEVLDADQDVEIRTSGYVERPEFYADSGTTARILTGRRYRSSTGAGNQVCHRGARTGYSCGLVGATNFKPAYGGACGAVACSPVHVLVNGAADTACGDGDSGGPVFASQTAFGLVKAALYSGYAKGQCDWFAYMSTDFLPTGWTLLYG